MSSCIMISIFLDINQSSYESLKAGVHGLSVNISVTFQATLNLSAYLINHCLAVLCKFLSDFFGHFGKEVFFLKG